MKNQTSFRVKIVLFLLILFTVNCRNSSSFSDLNQVALDNATLLQIKNIDADENQIKFPLTLDSSNTYTVSITLSNNQVFSPVVSLTNAETYLFDINCSGVGCPKNTNKYDKSKATIINQCTNDKTKSTDKMKLDCINTDLIFTKDSKSVNVNFQFWDFIELKVDISVTDGFLELVKLKIKLIVL